MVRTDYVISYIDYLGRLYDELLGTKFISKDLLTKLVSAKCYIDNTLLSKVSGSTKQSVKEISNKLGVVIEQSSSKNPYYDWKFSGSFRVLESVIITLVVFGIWLFCCKLGCLL